MNIKRFQGLAQALFPSDAFPPTLSSTHIRQQWANLKNNMAGLFKSPVDCLSEKQAGRTCGSRPVGSPSFSKHVQAQKTGQALCWVQGDGTPRAWPPSRQSSGETGLVCMHMTAFSPTALPLLLPATQSPHTAFWGLN